MGAEALRVARELACARDPRDMAAAAGAVLDTAGGESTLAVSLLGRPVVLRWPGLEADDGVSKPPDHVLALVLYYLALSDGTPPSGRTISFAELPDGRFYVQAFRGYTGAVLGREFAERPDSLERAALSLGGRPVEGPADQAWEFDALPNVPLRVMWWNADEEFDARAEVMFDENAAHHLTTDGCAVLGSWLTSMLLDEARS